ncbi:protein glass-like [Ischnura elegans]|uniref:protein glass-like n=1 Tax=Ischnura elegans TaxID=197161 RepID=UPI001ED8BB9E|nr:protein glass-like [Ischnura elegans]
MNRLKDKPGRNRMDREYIITILDTITNSVDTYTTNIDPQHYLLVAVGDGLPATLCALCLEKLIEFNDFRNVCHKSDGELRNFSCINNSGSIGGEGAVHDNLRSSTETKDFVPDATVSTFEKVCSDQPNEIFIPVPDIQLPTANMLFHVKEENMDPLREENDEVLHGTAPDVFESDAVDPLATDDLFHAKVENKDHFGEESYPVVPTPDPAGNSSDASDPLATDDLSGRGTYMSTSVKVDKSGDDEEENDCTDWASIDLMPHASADQPHSLTASGGKEVDDGGRGVILTDLDWKFIEAKKEPSPEEGDAAKPTLNENGEFIENLAMDVESTVGAAGLPAPERSQMKASSPSYLLALGDVRTDEKYGRIPPSTTVTCVQSKSEASHAEEGRNVIDKDLGKCSTLIHGEGTSCLFPSDGQSYSKDMQASKISGVGTRKSFVVVGCDALDATNTLSCIETREKADSGNEAVMGENEESSNYLIKNPGNSCRSNESSYHYLSTRDGFNSKDEVSKHLQTNLGARNLDGDAELSDYSCRICEKCFFRKDHLNEHMRSHVGDKPYVCDVCSKPISSKKNLVIHCRTHTGERPFSCSICCKSFYQSCDVTRHMRTHTMEKPYACSICCNRFSQSSGLVKHARTHGRKTLLM